MRYATPEDPGDVSVWKTYVMAQVSQAALGQIPANAVALGVAIADRRVRLIFQLTRETEQDREDMAEIADDLEALSGDVLDVEIASAIVAHANLAPSSDVAWVYQARVAESSDA